MKIKRLELAGFKSFLDKTRFEFDVPITSVVGPNGCGKSNIVDALKWVTGELSYKQLRGRNSEDLIFAGSDRRPPTSMMEVAITLDNELRTAPPQYNEYAEITVLRRIFRDGTSEFFINKTPCRLRDIVDLFLDTGIGQISYSIIEQGKIGAIVSSRAEDRRLMIEEAAGITKFKNRKKAAERKMEYTKQNLLRVNDVTSELKKQISSLERQAKKAEKYHGYKTEYENLDISIAGSEYLQIQEDVKKLKGLETQLQDSLTECSSILSDTQARHEAEKENLSEVEESFQQSQQRLFQKKSEIQDSSNKKDNVRAEIDRTATLLEESVIKVQSLEAKISEYEDKTQTIQKELSDLEETRTGFQARFESKNKELEVHTQSLSAKQDTLDKVKQQDLEIYKEQTQIKSSIESKKSRIEELEREVQKYNQNFQQLREELQDKESKHLDYKKSLEEISQLCFSFEENQKAIRSSIELLNEKKNQLHQDIMSCEKEINEYQTRLEALQEFSSTYQGYAKGVQDIMAKKEQGEQGFASVVGVLGHLIKPEKGYQKAVQAALDKLVECIVVDSHSDTGRYIDFLEEKGGRGVFLSKSFDNGDAKETISDPAILGCLLDFVSIDAELKKSVGYLFSNTYVVESIQEALDLQDRGVRASFVTLKGEVLSDHGVLQGGSLDHSLGDFEVLAQIEELKDKLVPLKAQKQSKDQEYQQTVRDLEKQAIQLKNISETLENELRKNLNLEKEFQKVEDQLSFTKEKIAEISEKISLYTQEKNQLGNVLDELDSKSQSLDASKKKVEESVQSQQQELVEIKTLHDEISTAVNELKIQFTTSVERIEGYRRELGIVQHQKTEAKTELEKTQNTIQTCKENTMSFTQTLENMHIQIEGMTTEYKDLESRNAVLQSQHDEVLEKIRQTEVLLKSTRDARESKQNELNQLQVKLSEHSMHMNHLQEQVFEKYETNLYEVTSSDTFERVELEDIGHQKGDLQEIKRKIEKIGNVNLAAIEEISEHTQRYDFLSEQKNDLEKSLASLSEAIKKINQTSKERFEETFEAIATRFHEIFPRLFSGGKGKLVLTDPENILTSGVDIQAQPPGKKLQNMNLLSGGEKALTAIALLFAIFEYKAPPFCVLDEVDAPLDDVNVMRYISIVEKMAKQTQFIVITHNKKTMEMADHLYGVTMEEPGVSRVVSVRLNQDEFIEKHALDTDQNRSVA